MNNYNELTTINDNKQKAIDEIRSTCTSLNKSEDALREKIALRKEELNIYIKDFTSIIDTYNQIIKSSHHK